MRIAWKPFSKVVTQLANNTASAVTLRDTSGLPVFAHSIEVKAANSVTTNGYFWVSSAVGYRSTTIDPSATSTSGAAGVLGNGYIPAVLEFPTPLATDTITIVNRMGAACTFLITYGGKAGTNLVGDNNKRPVGN